MEDFGTQQRKIAWTAAYALIIALAVLILTPTPSTTAAPQFQCAGGTQECGFTGACGCEWSCHWVCPPGGGGEPGGGTPPPPQGTPRPVPTVVPPTGAPGGGYYTTFCLADGSSAGYGCVGSGVILSVYVAPGGAVYVIDARCVSAHACELTTPTPPPPHTTPTPPPWPCNTQPAVGSGGITQPCSSQWPGWDLSVAVKIPPVNMARNPWPRSLVALETKFCFVSAPDSEEKFSDNKAKPCNASGESDEGTWDCGGETGEVSEGDRVNYQLGVAWRRFVGADPGFGTQPPFQSALNLEDRDWNGGSKVLPLLPGQCTAHTYETSSYGLPQIGETWNAECQDRECAYAERTVQVDRGCEACDYCWCNGCTEAYAAFIQTWWWPEWTFAYDQYVCKQKEPDDCFYDPNPGGRGCSHGPNAGQAGWKETVSCTRWGWEHVVEPWNLYDVRRQGLPLPFIGSGRTATAGMTPEKQVKTPFIYSPAVPVIEVQPVAP